MGQVADECLVVHDALVVELVVVEGLEWRLPSTSPQLLLNLEHALECFRVECASTLAMAIGVLLGPAPIAIARAVPLRAARVESVRAPQLVVLGSEDEPSQAVRVYGYVVAVLLRLQGGVDHRGADRWPIRHPRSPVRVGVVKPIELVDEHARARQVGAGPASKEAVVQLIDYRGGGQRSGVAKGG